MKKSVVVILVLTTLAFMLVLFNGYNSITGLQVLNLPAPPSPPGMEQEQQPQQPEPPAYVPVCGNDIIDDNEQCERNTDCGAEEICRLCSCVPEPTDEAEELVDVEIDADAEVLDRIAAIEQMLTALDLLPVWEERLNNVEQQAALAANFGARIDALESRVQQLEVDMRNVKSSPDVQAAFFDQMTDLKSMSRRNAMLSISLSVFVLLIVGLLIAAAVMGRIQEKKENKELVKEYLDNYTKAGYSLETLKMHLRASGWKDAFIDGAIRELGK